ncbi:N-acetylmuramoyl-L-alanine amidase [Altericista sp. CCNU0014]|uniref:N-acetylmuramoyl-L-alanine amidase n=1 Tax=Altericista sp. CCNU0014 TaxID=3082949 RepID=UPI0038503616
MGASLRFCQKQSKYKVMALLGGIAGSVVGFGLLTATPAVAARLQSWRFDANANRLEFATDETIQPRVQLLPTPVRLVVDLPGVKLDRPTLNQSYSAAVRSIRVGQFDAQTARIVVELSPGYTVDPQQVKVNVNANGLWSIDLPTPQFVQNAPDTTVPSSSPLAPPAESGPGSARPIAAPFSPAPAAPTLASSWLDDVLVTKEGLFLKIRQPVAGAQVARSRNRREISVDLNGVRVAASLARNDYSMNYHGVRRVSVRQISVQPPVARVTLRVDRDSPDWSIGNGQLGGMLMRPQAGAAAIANTNQPTETISLLLGRAVTAAASNNYSSFKPSPSFLGGQSLANLQNIALGGSQLLIQADRLVPYTVGWEGPRYRITFRGAQWSTNIRGPQAGAGSAITDIALRQEGQNASILVTPAPGVRIGTIGRTNSQGIVLNLSRPGSSSAAPSATIFQPNVVPNAAQFPQPNLPRPNGRRVVVIDPGHGGSDPGAIGIGGLRETDITLAMSLEVVRLLQQQGLQVYLTRSDESREVDLPPRVALAKQVRADVFVSIHANSINMSRPDVNGTETYYAPGAVAGRELAQTILNSITRSVNIQSRGLRAARFYVVRNTPMPATLVETGFVTGADDAPKLRDPNFQRQMAAAIANGIIEFLNRR